MSVEDVTEKLVLSQSDLHRVTCFGSDVKKEPFPNCTVTPSSVRIR